MRSKHSPNFHSREKSLKISNSLFPGCFVFFQDTIDNEFSQKYQNLSRLCKFGKSSTAIKICYPSLRKYPRKSSVHAAVAYFLLHDLKDAEKALEYGRKKTFDFKQAHQICLPGTARRFQEPESFQKLDGKCLPMLLLTSESWKRSFDGCVFSFFHFICTVLV